MDPISFDQALLLIREAKKPISSRGGLALRVVLKGGLEIYGKYQGRMLVDQINIAPYWTGQDGSYRGGEIVNETRSPTLIMIDEIAAIGPAGVDT